MAANRGVSLVIAAVIVVAGAAYLLGRSDERAGKDMPLESALPTATG